jgi:hypothetical protein
MARELASKPPMAFARTKQLFAETTGLLSPSSERPSLDSFMDQWFSPEAMALKRALVDGMQKRP